MNIEEVKTFLEIVNQGSISAASKSLFVSQSTISNRLQLLEKELQVQLIEREKGIREVVLTPYGERFIPIAQKLLDDWQGAIELKKSSIKTMLRVGCVDIVNTYTFSNFYEQFIENHPEYLLSLNTHHSGEIYGLLENEKIDLGFVYSSTHSSHVKTIPFFKEEMFLISNLNNDYYDGISPEKLRPQDEVYLRWSTDYEIWHDYYWPGVAEYSLKVNTGSILSAHLQKRNRWAIVPHAAVININKVVPIAVYKLESPPPARICYQLTRNDQAKQVESKINIFLDELKQFLRVQPYIELYERE